MIKTIAIVVVVALGALLLYAATQPDTFSVQRSASINAPADKIHPLIDDLHRRRAKCRCSSICRSPSKATTPSSSR